MDDLAQARVGHRGYISPRPVRGNRIAQHVQNLVVRDYCVQRGLSYRLSVVEYVMPGCYMMLRQALDELPRLAGIVAYTLHMLPRRPEHRQEIYKAVLDQGASLHFALEGLVLSRTVDAADIEDIWGVQQAIDRQGDILPSLAEFS